MQWWRHLLWVGVMAFSSIVSYVDDPPPPVSKHADFDARHAKDAAVNPPDLHFKLGLLDGKTRFYPGGRITLTLEFSSDSPNTYKLNSATYDRSGRLPTEEIVLDQDVVDPFSDYFDLGVMGGLGGGLRTYPVLTEEPYRICVDLNEWFRFDRPGRYRLYLKSHRVERERMPDEPGERSTVLFAPASNILEIEILDRDLRWEAVKLVELKAVLEREPKASESGGALVGAVWYEREQAESQAWSELQYLATREAVDYALERAKRKGESPPTLVLVGARDRQHAASALGQYLADPSVSIDAWDVRLLALFTFVRKERPHALGLDSLGFDILQGKMDSAKWESMRRIIEFRRNRFERYVREEASRLIPAVMRKSSDTRKRSGEAIASIVPEAAVRAGLAQSYDYGMSRSELIVRFDSLLPEQQSALLEEKWHLVRGREMAPVLLRLVEHKSIQAGTTAAAREMDRSPNGYGLARTAMGRLYDLDSDTATAFIRREFAAGRMSFAKFALERLPAQEMPEADAAFERVALTGYTAERLIAKFGTRRLLPAMRQVYMWKGQDCMNAVPVITYLARVFPEREGEGRQALRRALANRVRCGVYRDLLSEVSWAGWNGMIEAQAIESLDDPDPEVAQSAARMLSAYGGPEVEAILWRRVEKWSAKWRGREHEVLGGPIAENPQEHEARLGDSLFEAIAYGKAWWFDEPRRKRLVALCLDERCRRNWRRSASTALLRITPQPGTQPRISYNLWFYPDLRPEELDAKLAQAPRGLTYRWCAEAERLLDLMTPEEIESERQRVERLLSARGSTLAPYDKRACTFPFDD